jgi:hypothetical protein
MRGMQDRIRCGSGCTRISVGGRRSWADWPAEGAPEPAADAAGFRVRLHADASGYASIKDDRDRAATVFSPDEEGRRAEPPQVPQNAS